jgi:hypothetical protein
MRFVTRVRTTGFSKTRRAQATSNPTRECGLIANLM